MSSGSISPQMGREPTPAAMRTLIVGDVHGCVDELSDLLSACAIDDRADLVILVGDLVAKGPDSQGVVQLARERNIQAVLGNHDAKVLTFAPVAGSSPARSGGHGKDPKHHERVARTLRPEDWRYLERLPLYLTLPGLETVVVHGGLVFGVPFDRQERDVVINMRSITPDGMPSKRVEGGVPWASVWPGPTHVVFGHDAVRGLQQHRFATGLDSGCVYGRSLTGLILPECRLVAVPARRRYVAF